MTSSSILHSDHILTASYTFLSSVYSWLKIEPLVSRATGFVFPKASHALPNFGWSLAISAFVR